MLLLSGEDTLIQKTCKKQMLHAHYSLNQNDRIKPFKIFMETSKKLHKHNKWITNNNTVYTTIYIMKN
jgi:hypothetical protein